MQQFNLIEMWRSMLPLAKTVVIILAVMSVYSLFVMIDRFNTFMKDLRAEVPYVGRIATETGARVDRQFIELGARCAEPK